MIGTVKQVEWANNIKERATSFYNRTNTLRQLLEDAEMNEKHRSKLIDITDEIFDKVNDLNDMTNAGDIINWYGYLGLEEDFSGKSKRRKYRESYEKFLGDILGDNREEDVEKIMKLHRMAK